LGIEIKGKWNPQGLKPPFLSVSDAALKAPLFHGGVGSGIRFDSSADIARFPNNQ